MYKLTIILASVSLLSGCMKTGSIETRTMVAYAPVSQYVAVKACGRPDAPAFPKLGSISNEDC